MYDLGLRFMNKPFHKLFLSSNYNTLFQNSMIAKLSLFQWIMADCSTVICLDNKMHWNQTIVATC